MHAPSDGQDSRLALLEAVLDAMPAPVFVQNDRREAIYMNAAARRLAEKYGFPALSCAMPATQPSGACDDVERALAGETRTAEKRMGDDRTALAKAAPVRLPDGSSGVLMTGFDISAYKQAEARSKVIESDSLAKSQFLANMSHEILTPLNGVLGMAQALAEHGGLSAAQNDMVASMMGSGRTLMAIINDVLDLSRIDAGRLAIAPADVDVVSGLHRVIDLFRPHAEEKGIALSLSLDLDLPRHLRFDPVRTRQCLGNLLSNAIKFTDTGRIIVSARLIRHGEEGLLELAVSDTGPGIPASDLPVLFDAFWQADSASTRRHGGAGLGLPITLRLARMMGGDLTVESEPGHGSTFRLTVVAHASDAISVEPDNATPATINGVRLLIVDDNPVNRKVTRMFTTPLGVTVTEAENGRDALGVLACESFDAVLMDMHMPVMDGAEAIRRIRAGEAGRKDIPIVALTADALSGDRERYLAMGANAYVAKPIDQRELVATIVGLLQNARAIEHIAPEPEAQPVIPPAVRASDAGALEGLEDLFAEIDRLAG